MSFPAGYLEFKRVCVLFIYPFVSIIFFISECQQQGEILGTVCRMSLQWRKTQRCSQGGAFQAAEAASLPARQCWSGPSWSWSGEPGPAPARSKHAPTRGQWCSEHISQQSALPLGKKNKEGLYFLLFAASDVFFLYLLGKILYSTNQDLCERPQAAQHSVWCSPCSSCARMPGWGSSEPDTWWDPGKTLGTRKAHPAPSCPAARTELCRIRWAGRMAGSTDTGLELIGGSSGKALLWYQNQNPDFRSALSSQTYSEAARLWRDPTRCRESLTDSSPRSRGNTPRETLRLGFPLTAAVKSAWSATSFPSPQRPSVQSRTNKRIRSQTLRAFWSRWAQGHETNLSSTAAETQEQHKTFILLIFSSERKKVISVKMFQSKRKVPQLRYFEIL